MSVAPTIAPSPGAPLIPALAAQWPTFGAYRLLRRVGEGGMAVVFEAEHEMLQRRVALKIQWPHLGHDAQHRARFLAEARAAAAIVDPHVVPCFDLGVVGTLLYMSYAWVDGGDAEQLRIVRGGRLPEAEALRIVRDAAAGLEALDRAGVVHRDLKPHNLLLDGSGRALIADLGLSLRPRGERVTIAGYCVGTPEFMAPEQARGEPGIDVRADVYAIGATLFHLLVGRPPFEGTSPWGVLTQVVSDPFPDPRELRPEIGDAVASLIMAACSRDAAQRHQSPAELRADIELVMAGQHPRRTCAGLRRASPSRLARIAGGTPEVLLVDDDRILLRIHESRLSASGMRVRVAATAADALAAWRERRPDFALVDLMLPDRPGVEVIRAMRAESGAEIPIVAFTNSIVRGDSEAALAAGADEVLVKAHHLPRHLVEVIRRRLAIDGAGASASGSITGRTPSMAATRTDFVADALRRLEAVDRILDQRQVLADAATRAARLTEALALVHGLVGGANVAGLAPVAALADTAAALLRNVLEKPVRWTESMLRTLQQAAACLRMLVGDPQRTAALPHLATLRGLALDDEGTSRRLLVEALALVGVTAQPCETAAEALDAARARRHALVVADVLMPGMDGRTFAEHLRRMPGYERVPVVFVTALADFVGVVGAEPQAYTDAIAKPVQLRELATKALARLLASLAREGG